jgi:AcrR family transcriptional regulator
MSTEAQAPRSPRTGRRPGPSRTRQAITDAARAAFAAHGYDAVSIRAVARAARVDPALVHRFFGSKEDLFVTAMELPFAPGQLAQALLAGGREGLGEHLVETLLDLNDPPGGSAPFVALLRGAVSNEQAARMLREFLTTEVLGRVAAAAAPDQPELRAALAGSQILGLVMARYVVRIPPAVAADPSQLTACVGPTIQRYLTGALTADPTATGEGAPTNRSRASLT